MWDCRIIWMKISVLQEMLTYLGTKFKICPILINEFCIYWIICIILNQKGLSHFLTYMLIYSEYLS